MNLNEIQDLIKLVSKSGLTEVEIEKKDFSLVPSKYIQFVNRDENIDFDEKMFFRVRLFPKYRLLVI